MSDQVMTTTTYYCKLSVDQYYGTSGKSNVNKTWFNLASRKLMYTQRTIDFYRLAGYNVADFQGSISANSSVPWIAREMRANRIVQIHWKPDGTNGHASLINRIRYLPSRPDKFIINLMNPARNGNRSIRSLRKVNRIFSISK